MAKIPANQTVKEYLHNQAMRLNTRFRITGGKGYYVLKDNLGREILVERKDFEDQYPVRSSGIGKPLKIWKGDNPDGSKKWME